VELGEVAVDIVLFRHVPLDVTEEELSHRAFDTGPR
jgi:hypothetical protein